MKLRQNQLTQDLSKAIRPIYLLSGDEPLLMQEASDQIRAACKQAGFTERRVFHVDKKFDWNLLQEEADTLSLFAEKKLIELRLGSSKPGTVGSKAIVQYLENPNEDNVLLIETAKMDSNSLKSKWINSIEKAGCLLQIWPIKHSEMPQWIGQRASAMGLALNRDAIALLSERLEGNLLAAVQELEKLKLNFADQEIDVDAVTESVGDSSRYDVFNLTDTCLLVKDKKAQQVLIHLRAEGLEPSIVLWALSKEIRLLDAIRHGLSQGGNPEALFRKHRVIGRRQGQVRQAAQRFSPSQIKTMLELSAQCDAQIKGMIKAAGHTWDTLADITLLLSGTNTTFKPQASL